MAVFGAAALGFALHGDDSPREPTPSLLDPEAHAARLADADEGDSGLRVPPKERPQVHGLSFAGDGEMPLVWYHPIAGERRLPENPSREFGAQRPGQRPGECGEGHCGVDLGYERGEVIHAVRPGLVDRIVRARDQLSGKYVRLYHPEGFFTYYMHLDEIRPTLVPGAEVSAGEPLGLLGDTGIQHSPPHLHFAVSEILEGGAARYVDPEPMLEQAAVLDEPAPFPDEWREGGPGAGRVDAHLAGIPTRSGGSANAASGAEGGETADDREGRSADSEAAPDESEAAPDESEAAPDGARAKPASADSASPPDEEASGAEASSAHQTESAPGPAGGGEGPAEGIDVELEPASDTADLNGSFRDTAAAGERIQLAGDGEPKDRGAAGSEASEGESASDAAERESASEASAREDAPKVPEAERAELEETEAEAGGAGESQSSDGD